MQRDSGVASNMRNNTKTMKFITEKDLLRMLKCSPRHLLNLRQRRLLPYTRLGRSIRYDVDDIERALKKLTVREHGFVDGAAR